MQKFELVAFRKEVFRRWITADSVVHINVVLPVVTLGDKWVRHLDLPCFLPLQLLI